MFKCLFLAVFFSGINTAYAQRYDFGLWLGGSDYFGDLNSHTSLRFINPGGGVFARYNFDNRLSFRVNVNAGHVWADDAYSPDYYERTRNLGFSSHIYEGSAQVEFNFIPFTIFSTNAYTAKHWYTPYVLLGFGAFHFNPMVVYNDEKTELQPLGTEGQVSEFSDLNPYKRVSTAWILGGGIKWRVKANIGMQFEAGVRKTSTDYLDDVSGIYFDPVILRHEGGEMLEFLSDPSVEILGEPVGQTGKMRGDSSKSDDYLFIGFGIIYTIRPYKCPFQQ